MKRLATIVLSAILLAACRDGPSDPAPTVQTVLIQADGGNTAPDVLAVGQSAQLATTIRDGDGRAIAGQTVQWSSSNAAVATVTNGGLVTARAPGHVEISAAVAGRADVLRLRVCEPGTETAPALGVGEAFVTSAACAQTLRVAGAAGAEYLLVPFHASTTGTATVSFSMTATGVQAISAASAALVSAAAGDDGGPRPDGAFDLRLREVERRTLTHRMAEARQARAEADRLAPSFSLAAVVPTVGSTLTLNVLTAAATEPDVNPCTDARGVTARTGRVVAVTERAIVVVDGQNPQTQITDAEYRSFGTTFDTLVSPLMRQTFGEPSDVDRNGRVIIFYTRGVNELTPRNSNSYVGGFFWSGDLFPKTAARGASSCANGNAAEVLYMLAPDPGGAVNSNARSDALVRQTTVSVIGHELQHVINAGRRLYVNGAPTWEDSWLNEGLSHIAEELLFYRASGLGPRQNLDAARINAAPRARLAFDQYQASNHTRLVRYLENPAVHSMTQASSSMMLETRGAAWAFLRYAADRANRDEQQLWGQLANSRTAGVENLRMVLGTDPLRWMQDWSAALFVDDFVAGAGPALSTPSWNHRATMPITPGSNGRFPLLGTTMQNGAPVSLSLVGGGAAHLRLRAADGEVTIRTAAGSGPASERLKLTLVRTR